MGISNNAMLIYGIDLSEELPELISENMESTGLDDPPEWLSVIHGDYPNLVFESHCSYEYSMWIISIKGMMYMSRRGYPESIPQILAEPTPEALSELERFCNEFEITGEPTWLLTSMNG